jgi:hypothetical protein
MERCEKLLSIQSAIWILITVALSACATVQETKTIQVLKIPPYVPHIDFLDSNDFAVTVNYAYVIGSTDKAIVVPQGFVTDFASIPWGLRWLLAKQGRYSRAALVHDYLYWSQICTKKQADNILMIAMKESHVVGWQRFFIYEGVSLAGGGAWSEDRAERLAGEPKVIPEKYYSLATDGNWPKARQVLMRDHVADPLFPQNPAACALGNSDNVP